MHLLVDSASLYYRSYYALPESMTAPDGHPHNAIRGFLTTMTRLLERHGPATLVCAWDLDWRPQWRVDLLPSYKTHRLAVESDGEIAEETPETLGPQVDALAAILDSMGVARPGADRFEADDVLATVANTVEGRVIVVSGDRDLVQLVDQRVHLLLTVNGGMEKWPILDPEGVLERFGVTPERYVELAVLRGDPSDGLPGVPGIGAKTAVTLVNEFAGLEQIIDAAQAGAKAISPKRAEAIVASADYLRAAQVVATAVRDVPLDARSLKGEMDADGLTQLAAQWGVERQVRDLQKALATTSQ